MSREKRVQRELLNITYKIMNEAGVDIFVQDALVGAPELQPRIERAEVGIDKQKPEINPQKELLDLPPIKTTPTHPEEIH